MIKFTIKNSIVEILSKKELNLTEISAELQMPKANIKVYLSTLLKEGKIKRITPKKPFKYVATNNETYFLTKIREMFESGVIKAYSSKLTDEYKKILEYFQNSSKKSK